MNIRATLFIGLLAISSAANADYPHNMNAGVLRADCELLDRPSQVRCEAFLMGVVDAVAALSFSKKLKHNFYCIPERVTEIQLRQAFVKYVRATHVKISDPGADVALAAFGSEFPCK